MSAGDKSLAQGARRQVGPLGQQAQVAGARPHQTPLPADLDAGGRPEQGQYGSLVLGLDQVPSAARDIERQLCRSTQPLHPPFDERRVSPSKASRPSSSRNSMVH